MEEPDRRFYVATSTIPGAGEGLFAGEALNPGDRLLVVGVLIERNSVADRCTSFADHYKVRAGDALLIPMGWAAKVNHRDEPNVRKVAEGSSVYLEVLRPISEGEEIVFRYHEYATARFVPSK